MHDTFRSNLDLSVLMYNIFVRICWLLHFTFNWVDISLSTRSKLSSAKSSDSNFTADMTLFSNKGHYCPQAGITLLIHNNNQFYQRNVRFYLENNPITIRRRVSLSWRWLHLTTTEATMFLGWNLVNSRTLSECFRGYAWLVRKDGVRTRELALLTLTPLTVAVVSWWS